MVPPPETITIPLVLDNFVFRTVPVPEPSTLLLFGSALAGTARLPLEAENRLVALLHKSVREDQSPSGLLGPSDPIKS